MSFIGWFTKDKRPPVSKSTPAQTEPTAAVPLPEVTAEPPPPLPLPVPVSGYSIRNECGWACVDCGWTSADTDNQTCKRCASPNIYNIQTILDHEHAKAAQRLKIAETITAAAVRNDLALLTGFTDPPDPDKAA